MVIKTPLGNRFAGLSQHKPLNNTTMSTYEQRLHPLAFSHCSIPTLDATMSHRRTEVGDEFRLQERSDCPQG